MFETRCTYQPTALGPIFLPEDIESDYHAKLRVHFDALDYYPAEPDVGAGPDFDAAIGIVEIMDRRDRNVPEPWRALEGDARQAAIDFLEKCHHNEMWAQADEDAAEAFGVTIYRRAA